MRPRGSHSPLASRALPAVIVKFSVDRLLLMMYAWVLVLGSGCTHVPAFSALDGSQCQNELDLYPGDNYAHAWDVIDVPGDSDVNFCAIFRFDFEAVL